MQGTERCNITGFGAVMGPWPRNAGSLQKLEKARKILHYSLQKECSLVDTFLFAQ